ncbi:DUF411 domain-containing protein [Stenotrophomonas maltophilia]|uniref:DUF411 domain-containing protein n=1 Tax=Stenotrophomonas maltophilia TaxID=40324 RepID=UPI00223B781F|nr:DUF411 domain-containing protein [Stenotrophomonas maltophilia]
MKDQNKRKISPMLAFFAMCILLLVLLVAFTRVAGAVPAADRSAPVTTKAMALKEGQLLPDVLVHKSPGCVCCELWVKHLRGHGFKVRVNETTALAAIKKQVGIPAGKGSCHTALVGGLFVEGHVPADAIKAALATRTGARGLVLPGMPGGAPGMAAPPGGAKPYTVEWVDAKGATHPFRTYTPK